MAWTHDPNGLVPDPIPDPWEPLGLGLPDERPVESREDVLTFTSDALSAPLRIAGPVTLTLQCRSTFRTMHLFGKLLHVLPDGRALRITLGGAEIHAPDYERSIDLELG